MRSKTTFLTLSLLLGVSLAGCLEDGESSGTALADPVPSQVTFQVVDAQSGAGIFLAQVSILSGDAPSLVVTTDRSGNASVELGANVTGYEVTAGGYAPVRSSSPPQADVVIVRMSKAAEALAAQAGSLTFREPVDLGTRAYVTAAGTSCQDSVQDGDCGLGEPSVEVDALGQIYVTGVCCIGNAPPIYVSRDDGQTFQELKTPGIREAFGVEADLAIDAEGVMYMADIEVAGSFQVTAWDKDGTYLRHTKWPAPPLVDRDWVRAGGDGHLFYVYNTGGATNIYASTDGGATWSPAPVQTLTYGLGNAIKGHGVDELWIVGGSAGGFRQVDYTLDGGATWRAEQTSSPSGGSFPTGAFDEAGNLYLSSTSGEAVHVARRDTGGVWHNATTISPPGGHHRMAWLSAGGEGKVAVAWYGTLDDEITDDTHWYLFVAASLDANRAKSHWQVAVADPEPVVVGSFGRQLLDFLQIEVGPDGSIHVAYSKLPNDGRTEERLTYVHSEPTLPLAPATYFNGPY